MNGKGRVTIPTDMDVIEGTKELAKKWGADAVRDCDGTDFPEELKDEGLKVYSTYYTTRKDNAWAKRNSAALCDDTKIHCYRGDTQGKSYEGTLP